MRSFDAKYVADKFNVDDRLNLGLGSARTHVGSRENAAPCPTVLMSIRVDSGCLAAVRKTLHQWLGASLDIYTAVIDNKSAQACLQVEIAASRIADVMSVVMRALPEAEFGTIRPSPRTAAIQH